MTGPTPRHAVAARWRILFMLLATTFRSTTSFSAVDTTTSNNEAAVITGFFRYSVKGLSPDSLQSVWIANSYDTFPDDRRFALLYEKQSNKFDESNPEWLHKENFLCAFTDPKLMAQYEASYQIVLPSSSSITDTNVEPYQQRPTCTYGLPNDGISSTSSDDDNDNSSRVRRLLSLRERATTATTTTTTTEEGEELASMPPPFDLETQEGRDALGDFFSKKSGRTVQCVTAATPATATTSGFQQKHQFGNTSSGWKQRNKDTRTIHIINANTVKQVAEKCNLNEDDVILRPTRFRPNIVVEGWEPWIEFDWIGKTLEIHPTFSTTNTDESNNNNNQQQPMRLTILSKTVRCDGVSIDPLDYPHDEKNIVLDIPKLLTQHFPEHGPYLGVYAVIDDPGLISLGDTIRLSSSTSTSSSSSS